MKASMLACAAAAGVLAVPASAAGLGDWAINPYTVTISSVALTVGGEAQGSVFTPEKPATSGFDQSWGGTGAADVTIGLQRDYDNGMSMSLKSMIQAAHDPLSQDNYGGNILGRLYGTLQTGLGRVELGMTDGAAYVLSVTGPVVDSESELDNPNATFFRNPATGKAVIDVFTLNSAVESSLNYAKISYYTPRLFGIQLAASYTPSQGRSVLPFLSPGSHVPDRQKSMWEAAASYSDYFGRVAVGFYGGFTFAHAEGKPAGREGLTDWGFGTEIDYTLSDDIKVSIGGAHRHSNAYTFDINQALAVGGTGSTHLSATISDGPWILGGEYGIGTADGGGLAPTINVHGTGASVGYVFNANLQATLGWQQLIYRRDTGLFYNGAQRAPMDAVFLHLRLHV